jgi:hypothetical protein
MTDASQPNPQLLRSLGRLVRGLSALFWGLPIALIICFHTARADSLKSMGILPPMAATGWLLYGLWHLGDFQPQERVWQHALGRARLLAMILFGLSPFLYWWNRLPTVWMYSLMVALAGFNALLFLLSLNLVLQRLGAMLPDEGLRLEIRQFTGLNFNLLVAMLLLAVITYVLAQLPTRGLPLWLLQVRTLLDRGTLWVVIPLFLLPLAMTMALLWKTKEVILDSVFTGGREQ